MPLIQINDDELNKKLCGSCSACCEYINIPIPTPKTEEDFDDILWYILHKNVTVWIDKKNKWYVEFNTPCTALKKGRCTRYQTRPFLCRDYSKKTCEKNNPVSEVVESFTTQESFLTYLRKNKKTFFGFYVSETALD